MTTESGIYEAEQRELEMMIDSTSLVTVLEMLVDICGEKAEHLRSNWQDGRTARAWDKAGDVLSRLVVHKGIAALG